MFLGFGIPRCSWVLGFLVLDCGHEGFQNHVFSRSKSKVCLETNNDQMIINNN